jgi:hypothetical protein
MSIFNDKSLKGVADAVSKIMEASKKEENKFHNKLDKLVHGTFGDSPDEKKMKKEEKELSPKQKAIAKLDHPKHKIDSGDLAKLRAGHKPVKEETELNEMDTETPQGRYKADGTRSHSNYGSGEPPYDYGVGKWKEAKPLTKKQAIKSGTKLLQKAFQEPHSKKIKEESESCEDEAEEAVEKHEKKMHGKKGEVSKHEKQMHKEEVEQLDELSKDTLTSYRDKANVSQGNAYDAKMKAGRKGDFDTAHKHNTIQTKRGIGLGRVANRGIKPFGPMTKEEFSFTSLIESYKKEGLKSLSKMKKEEVDSETYEKEMKDQKDKFDGKKKGADVAKASVQAVKQEEVELNEISKELATKVAAKRLVNVQKDALVLTHPHPDDIKKLHKTMDLVKKRYGNSQVKKISSVADKMYNEEQIDEEEVDQLDENYIKYSDSSDSYTGKYKGKSFKVKAPGQSHQLTSTHVEKHNLHLDSEHSKKLAKHLRHYYRNVKHGEKYNISEEVELDEADQYTIQNTKTKQTYHASKYPITKDSEKYKKIKAAGGDHAHATIYKNGKPVTEEVELDEAEKMKGGDPCWKDYEMVGHKMKGGKKVPNCVPKNEEVELEERTLSEPETEKKEEIVKSMKKKMAGFKERYGDRAKEVMYATATARAKEKA